MKKICFLSCKSLGLIEDDRPLVTELEQNSDYEVSVISWDEDADWARFDLVLIRTPWDYPQRPEEFLDKLKLISSMTELSNSYEVVRWNYHKGYLKELESKGVKIVPTQMFTFPEKIEVPKDWNYDLFIVKPAISAGAYKTMIVSKGDLTSDSFLSELYPGDWMLQPFVEEIKNGEISLHFFHKVFSHAIMKTPKEGDFRVQEEHGGSFVPFAPEQSLLNFCEHLLGQIPLNLLYARVDIINWQGQYVLMELELIEPALYFRTNSQSVKHFKRALDKNFMPS